MKRIFIGLLIVAAFLLPVWIKGPYFQHIMITIFIWSILALGIRLILLVGHLNAAQASFMGMGAYISGILAKNLGWSFWICLPLSGIAVALLALMIGYPALRTKGIYFVIVTFGVTEVFHQIWMMWTSLFGGPQGLLGIPRPGAIEIAGLSISFASKVPFYYVALILLFITILVMHRLDISRVGLTLRAIPQAEVLAECVGVNVFRYKLLAFGIGSFFAGLAGSFWGHYFTYASPWDFGFGSSLYMLIYVVIGGVSSVAGPIVGCSAMLIIDELLRPIHEYTPIVLGAILIVVMLILPGGLISLPIRIRTMFRVEADEKGS